MKHRLFTITAIGIMLLAITGCGRKNPLLNHSKKSVTAFLYGTEKCINGGHVINESTYLNCVGKTTKTCMDYFKKMQACGAKQKEIKGITTKDIADPAVLHYIGERQYMWHVDVHLDDEIGGTHS